MAGKENLLNNQEVFQSWSHMGTNITKQKEFKENQVYPEAIEHSIKEEEKAKFYNSKLSEKQHCSFHLKSQVSLLVAVVLG